VNFRVSFKPFEIRTFRLKNGRIEECDMLEGSVPLA